MKLHITSIVTDEFSVSHDGETIGTRIDNIIAAHIEASEISGTHKETVTHVAVDITSDDMTALRLLRSRPAFGEDAKSSPHSRLARRPLSRPADE